MRKVSLMALIAMFAAIVLAGLPVAGKEKKMKTGTTKQARWHGSVVRSDKDGSNITVRRRGQNVEKIIHYSSATKWTTDKGAKAIDAGGVKDGDDVICLGKFDEKGEFQAEQIDLRAPK